MATSAPEQHGDDTLRQTLYERIQDNQRGKLTLKLKTLLTEFGFNVTSRVRQSSLEATLMQLTRWGIDHHFPGGTSAQDYVTLSLAGEVVHQPPTPPTAVHKPPAPPTAVIPARSGGVTLAHGPHRVLSVRPPWAWSILFAGKDIENRSWETPYRGPILIHASSRKYGGDSLVEVQQTIRARSQVKPPDEFPRSQILGVVDLIDIVLGHPSPWANSGECHWVLRNPRPLTEPIKDIDGKLNLWTWTY